jgi:hypothetical protein
MLHGDERTPTTTTDAVLVPPTSRSFPNEADGCRLSKKQGLGLFDLRV